MRSFCDYQSEELRTAALVLLHRLVDNQFALFVSSGKEMDLLTLVFSLRREKAKSLSNGCEAIVDTWSQRTDPILGLGTITSAMKNALVKAAMAESPDERIRVHTLGLKGLGKLLTRLPAEVVEDELPRAKELVTSVSSLHLVLPPFVKAPMLTCPIPLLTCLTLHLAGIQ